MKRQITEKLRAWKDNPRRKPLLLMGARQVGKTFTLKKFADTHFSNKVYINFENNPHLCHLFESSLNPKNILKSLAIETNTKISPNETLIIFDEVQECPNALNSLKYFLEEAPEYHIAAAGSLLGVKLIHTKGFPVGKVQFLTLYPMNFVEFLEALKETPLKSFIENWDSLDPLPINLHEKLLQLLKEYLYVGGMPEAVSEYLHSQDFLKVREVQQAILNAYSLDFSKHAAPHQVMKINQIWDSIPSQLAKENKKFVYSVLKKGARAKEFEEALQWLKEAGLIHKISNISVPKIPLKAYTELDAFKIYLADVGLLAAMSQLSAKTLLDNNTLFQEFKGAFIENYVAQELIQNYSDLYYWTSAHTAEVDYIIEEEGACYPLEVKSGSSTKKKSLQVYKDSYDPPLLIRTSSLNLKKDGSLLNCPIYLIHRLKELIQLENN